VPEQHYVDAVVADLEGRAALDLGPHRPQYLYRRWHAQPVFTAGIDQPAGRHARPLALEPDCEITLEANPGTFEKDRFKATDRPV
jgi:hypothetical protein